MKSSEICFVPANLLAGMIRDRVVSVREVMEAHLARIEEVNPKVNAIITLLPDEALRQARLADEALARNEAPGPLFGLPIAHKDLTLTKGIRTTFGSPLLKDFVPDQDQLIVERLKACPSASRSWAATRTISVCSSWPTRSSRQPASTSSDRRSESRRRPRPSSSAVQWETLAIG